MELGGKRAAPDFPDADVDAAVQGAILAKTGRWSRAGQTACEYAMRDLNPQPAD